MIRLQIFAGGQVERDESYSASEVTIGRTNANRLCLPANGVSARHCVIRRLGAGFELEDLESTNGTYVNRRRVRGRVLVGPQDEIIVATFTIRIMETVQRPMSGQTIVGGKDLRAARAAHAAKGRAAAKTFAPPLLPADAESPSGSLGDAPSRDQWPEPLPEVEDSKSAAASGSFKLQALKSSDPESKAAYRLIGPLAQSWRDQGRPEILLLEGEQLLMAQRWIARDAAQPQPSALQREFIELSSEHASKRRSKWVWAPLALVALVGVGFGVSRFALNDEISLDLPKNMSKVLPRVSSRADASLTVEALKPWMDKDPESAILASVAKLQSLGDQQDAETWGWEAFLRQALRSSGGVVLHRSQSPVTSLVMIPGTSRWVAAAQDGSLTLSAAQPNQAPVSLAAHQGAIRELLVDPEGKWLYSWGQDNVIKRWDLSGELSAAKGKTLTGLSAPPIATAMSSDGRFFAAAGEQGELRVWSVSGTDPNEKARSLGSSDARVTALYWAQGRLYVGDEKGNIGSWSAEGQKDRNTINVGEGVAEIIMTPDHRVMVVRGQERRSFRVRKKGPRWGKITGLGEIAASGILRMDPKGRFAISVAAEGEIVMWDPQSPDPARISVVLEGPGTAIEALALDRRDQRMIAADEEGALWSWELAPKDGRIVPRALGSQASESTVTALQFDENLSRWLVASSDGSVRAVDVGATLNDDASYVGRGHRGRLRSIAVSPDGRSILSGGDDQRVRLWSLGPQGQVSAQRILKGHRTPVTAVAFDKVGRHAYAAGQDGSILTWDLERPSQAPTRTLDHSAEVYDMLVTPDGKWLISVGADAKVLAYAIQDGVLGAPKPLSGHKQAIFTVATDPKSHYSVSAGQDRGVVVWDLSKGLSDAEGWRLDGHDKAIWAVAISPDLQWIASAGEDRRIHVHKVASLAKREPPAFVLEGHKGTIRSLAFSQDSRWLVSGGADKDLLAWDLSAKNPSASPMALSGHAQGVRALQFVAPGLLVSASRDGSLRLWNLHLKDASAQLLGHSAAVEDQVVARDGALVLTGSQDNTLRSWPIGRKALLDAACQRVGKKSMAPELARRYFKSQTSVTPCDPEPTQG